MSTEDRQQQTTVNVQEKANLIWAIADKLVGAGQRVEQSSFAAVRVACQGNAQIHRSFPHFCG